MSRGPEIITHESRKTTVDVLAGEAEVLLVVTKGNGHRTVIRMKAQEAQRIAGALNQAALKLIFQRVRREEGVIGGM